MRQLAPFLLVVLAGALPVEGQAVVYRAAPGDTLWFGTVNPYRLYWVQGEDTIGNPITSVGVESHVWSGSDSMSVTGTVEQRDLSVQRRVQNDTFRISRTGRVLEIRGPGDRPDGRHDFVLRLPGPGTPLEVGTTWTDTLLSSWETPRGEERYDVFRTHRVARLVDSMDARIAVVEADATIEFQTSFVVDSTTGTYLWLDVEGPAEETFWFDLTHGRMVGREWNMDLRGVGGLPNDAGGFDTVPGGLMSRETMRVIPEARARTLIRDLPGQDTTTTYNRGGAAVLLHTVGSGMENGTGRIEAGLARNDGLVGTVTTEFKDGVPKAHEGLWTDSVVPPKRRTVDVLGDTLMVQDTGRVTVPTEAEVWAIADYGMDEFLLPLMLRLPRDRSQHRIAVFRPYTGSWDLATATVMVFQDALLAAYQTDDAEAPSYLLFTEHGQLLYKETGPTGSKRIPPEGSEERARVEALLNAAGGS